MSLPGENNQYIVNYLTDTGEVIQISQKAKDSTAVGNIRAPFRQRQGPPPRWKLRYIRIQIVRDGWRYERKIVISDANNLLFRSDGPKTVNIDGAIWTVVGRVGESARGPYSVR